MTGRMVVVVVMVLMTAALDSHHLVVLFEDDIFLSVVEEEGEIGVGRRNTAGFSYPREPPRMMHDALHCSVVRRVEVLS